MCELAHQKRNYFQNQINDAWTKIFKKQKTYTAFVLLNNIIFLHYHIGEMAEDRTKKKTKEFFKFGDFGLLKWSFIAPKR